MGLLGSAVGGRAGAVQPSRKPDRSPLRMPGSYTILESFEAGLAHYGGDTGAASIATSADLGFPTGGSQYLSFDTGATGGIRMISSRTGLDQYPAQGDTLRWDNAILSDGEIAPILFTQEETSSPGGYSFRADVDDDRIRIVRENTDGTVQSLQSTAVPLSTGTRYIGEAKLREPDSLEMVLYDASGAELASVGPVTDPNFTEGGLGWRVSTSLASQVTAYADLLRVML